MQAYFVKTWYAAEKNSCSLNTMADYIRRITMLSEAERPLRTGMAEAAVPSFCI